MSETGGTPVGSKTEMPSAAYHEGNAVCANTSIVGLGHHLWIDETFDAEFGSRFEVVT